MKYRFIGKNKLLLHKELGQTPLQAMELIRVQNPALAGALMTYAGRLDPMAEGLLLVLLGEECKKKQRYLGLDKEYEFEVLFGISTDSGDVLGVFKHCNFENEITKRELISVSKKFLGEHHFPYPKYSSRTVAGKPLFVHARNSNQKIVVPSVKSFIYKLDLLDLYKENLANISAKIIARISSFQVNAQDARVGSDFRKNEILRYWDALQRHNEQIHIARFRAIVGSGTYIRTLSEKIGETLGVPALAYTIVRTKIGKFIPLGRGFGFWMRQLGGVE